MEKSSDVEQSAGERIGAASLDTCPREGEIWLSTKAGRMVRMRTTCKTWRCRGCRDRLLSLFRLRVQNGVSALGPCALITTTYRLEASGPRPVQSVVRDWKDYSRRFLASEGLKWLKVTELTRKGQPHHHLVAGPIEGQVRCYGRDFNFRRYRERFDSCACLSHRAARAWQITTGDSWMVHAMPVVSAGGAASYLGKYMTKTFLTPYTTRRYSTSRGWPGSGHLELKQTGNGGWAKQTFQYGRTGREMGGPKDLLERSGPQWALDQRTEMIKKRGQRRIRRLAGA